MDSFFQELSFVGLECLQFSVKYWSSEDQVFRDVMLCYQMNVS